MNDEIAFKRHECPGDLQGILCGLRRCLEMTNLNRSSPYFHYAEALVYVQPEEWWPILGPQFDILENGHWPENYPKLLERLNSPGVSPISMMTLLDKRGVPTTAYRPLLRPLSRKRQTQIRTKFAKLSNDLISASYIPGIDCYYGDFAPGDLCTRFSSYLEIVSQFPDYYPPAESGFMLLVPLTAQTVGVSLILAQIILMLDISADNETAENEKWSAVLSRDILPKVDAFSRASSALLLDRHEQFLVGYQPSFKASSLFVHPALTRPAIRSLLAFRDVGSHGGLAEFNLGYQGSPEKADGWAFLTVLKRTLQPFNDLETLGPPEQPEQFGSAYWFAKQAEECTNHAAPDFDIAELTNLKDTIHRWLKTLYADGGDGRPGSNYLLFREHLIWLAAIISKAIKTAWSSESSEATPTPDLWPCKILFAVHGTEKPNKTTRFSWPVVPGIRFLLPWLKLAEELRKELPEGTDGNSGVDCEAVLFEAGVPEATPGPKTWEYWKQNRKPGDGDEQRCGLILGIYGLDNTGAFCRSILRQLTSRHRRMGGTIHLFHDVLTCDLGRIEDLPPVVSVMGQGGIPPDIAIDLDSYDGRMLIAFTWTPPPDKA